MSKYRKASADATIAELFQRNPDLAAENPRLHPAAIDGELLARAVASMVPALKSALAPVPTEHEEQVALFQWAEANEAQYPSLAMLFAVPNGGYRPMVTAAQLKAEGVRSGVPDIFLMCRRGHYGALAIELKRRDHSNHATPAQQEWIERLRAHDYMAVVCYGAQEAIDVIIAYLGEKGAR